MKMEPGRPVAEEDAPPQRPPFLAAFRFRDFRLLWFGLSISSLGTWVQFTGLGYEVVHIAPNPHLGALYLGLIGASRAIPVLLLSPIAGVVADRLPRRAVLMTTNALTALLAFALAVLIASGHATIGWLMLLSGLAAGTQSFDTPARSGSTRLRSTDRPSSVRRSRASSSRRRASRSACSPTPSRRWPSSRR
jgi:MFS family permease